ncbi:MAG: beta-ketoacyl-ACP synthase II [Chloroflexi bacterium]|nr:beta-ketoacyl-ACP synthase II [Chloroflexota bacterium]MCI0818573.1 beta-ketoacyl-ACP synthase II [Chloroflexota bacterium]MCI0819753.1 beta-ketoacyl-ACP synthase II [Chloroflexota bacterium]MCI0832930.1 beta-ketoacyl-ACP synthase II [Chloroflexota bacterium]MCI0843294.1 beta-ketoacyl-ACP synthase II [Chloroflexota bacterium]
MPGRNGTRVVVTGMGAITPIGNSVQEFWDSAVAGKSGLGILSTFDHSAYPVHVAGEVKDFDPQKYMDRRVARRMGRFSQFAMAATTEAVRQADLDLEDTDRDRVGVLLGVGIGGLEESQKAVRTVDSRGGMRIDPFFFPKMLPNMAAAHIALNFGVRGYNNTVITACAAGTQAIGDAMDLVRAGRVDVCIAGGSEASLCELGLCGFAVIRSLSQNNDEPKKASRPFDAERDGFVAAEGAGILILESEEHAKARSAPVLAEVAGYGACSDAFHVVAPSEDGDGARRAMREALQDAGVETTDVDYINAHGTSTQLNDRSETLAIKALFGEDAYRVPISATKSMVGHSFGAAGAVESVAAVQTIVNRTIHPTINLEHADPECDLDYVPEGARAADVNVVLKNSFGFGGQNACLVFKRYEG